MARPKVHDTALRDRLLDVAARRIAAAGARALTLRTLAADAGTSTSAVYSLFGGKPDLFGALHRAAFADFEAAQRAAGITDDPAADLVGLALAYRDWALAHPHLYAVMFAGALAADLPPDLDLSHCRTAMEPLQQAAGRLIESGQATADATIADVSLAAWSAVHGFVSLDLLGLLDLEPAAATEHYEAAMHAFLRGWLRPGSGLDPATSPGPAA